MHRQHHNNNNGVPQPAPACAACKHQRKKCHETCLLASYFPADRVREFQAVHKVFGVSNVTKMVKNVREEERRKAVESLVWEAVCRQNDPVSGPYAEYKRVLEELKVCKLLTQNQNQNQSIITMNNNGVAAGQIMGLGYKPILPTCLGGWNNLNNNNNNNNNISSNSNSINNNNNNGSGGGVNSNNLLFNYLHENLSAIIDSSGYSNLQISESNKLMRLQQQDKDAKSTTSSLVVPFQHQHQQQHPNFHHCF